MTTSQQTAGGRAAVRACAGWLAGGLASVLAGALVACGGGKAEPAADGASAPAGAASAGKPALTVTVTAAREESWPRTLSANGNVAAWQEGIVGAEQGGLRLAEVRVNVGDRVRRGQVLARWRPTRCRPTWRRRAPSLAEAEATLADAPPTPSARTQLQDTGALSAQQINQYLTAEQTARARLQAMRCAAALRAGAARQDHGAGARRRRDLGAARDRRRGAGAGGRSCSA